MVNRRQALFAVAILVGPTQVAACSGEGDRDGSNAGDAEARSGKIGLVLDIDDHDGAKAHNTAVSDAVTSAAEELDLDTKELRPDGDGQNRSELIELLAASGYNPVIGVGPRFADSLLEIAQVHPATTFVIVDHAYPPEDSDRSENVKQLVFAEEEGAFLAGAAAARTSTSGRVGFIGGVETELTRKYEAGYVAGATQVKPDIAVDVRYLSQPPDLGGMDDPEAARAAATAMYDAGADVIFHASGRSGTGVFEAAVQANGGGETTRWAIGSDWDQYTAAAVDQRAVILTSFVKNVDAAVAGAIEEFARGDTGGGITVGNLKSGGVGYSTSGGHIEPLTDELDTLTQSIISREIRVPVTPEDS